MAASAVATGVSGLSPSSTGVAPYRELAATHFGSAITQPRDLVTLLAEVAGSPFP